MTFGAFCLVGFIPLVPFFFSGVETGAQFAASAAATGVAFLGIGAYKVVGRSPQWAALRTLFAGDGAAVIAYVLGDLLRDWVGVGL